MALRVRFGIFDFDPENGDLRREGVALRLQAQPAQVLAVLVQHAGEVVTREQLRQAVWGTATFVDFDQGLNYCIAQIRSTLGDSAESPRFVRTIPKRGYQFVAPVAAPAVPEQAASPVQQRHRVKRYVLATVLAVTACAVLALTLTQRRPTVNIAIARFSNETGSADMNSFADGLTDTVVAELTTAAGGQYGIIGNAASLRRPRSERDLKDIGSSLHAAYLVLGQVQRSSSQVRVLAHLIRLPQQTHITVVRFDRELGDQLQMQSELGRLIAAELLQRVAASSRAGTN